MPLNGPMVVQTRRQLLIVYFTTKSLEPFEIINLFYLNAFYGGYFIQPGGQAFL